MPNCKTTLRYGAALAVVSSAVLLAPAPGRAEVLYTLQTQCSLGGAAPQPCSVEAVNAADATLYRHRIGSTIATVRITGSPVTMARWDGGAKRWVGLQTASARFSSNTVCFNGRELCVVNPNYLNSVREENPKSTAQRDLVRVHFGADGRIDASCYDNGCEVTLK